MHPEIRVLRYYGMSEADIERTCSLMSMRLAAPTAVSVISLMVMIIAGSFAEVVSSSTLALNSMRAVVLVFALLALVSILWRNTASSRILVDLKTVLGCLHSVRRHHLLSGRLADFSVDMIISERKTAKNILITRARNLRKLVARSYGKRAGEPGFEECERLALWLFWASGNLGDEVHVHRAIRACRQYLAHRMGTEPWLVVKIDRPPNGAFMVSAGLFQRFRYFVISSFRGGLLTAVLGVVTGILGLMVKMA
jgi:hypothetical protein